MSSPPASLALAAHLAVLSMISFGGIPTVLPDIHNLVVVTKGWVTDQEFADFFAIAQALPGLPMILMMSLIGWKVGGLTGALASAVAICGLSCAVAFAAFRLGHRFRDAPWQRTVRRGLIPVTVGIVIASSYVVARAADTYRCDGSAHAWNADQSTVDAGYRGRHRRARPTLKECLLCR